MTDFSITKDAEGIATITWDCPGKSMNVMSGEALLQLDACIDDALADASV
jgi:3-hydroxyacyl-CoA dehydrogenase/enoyl-CoA hydratase/3-hydroxybutyryl-CoA epimerase